MPLAIEPDVLLMDEPFSALDEMTARHLRTSLLNIWTVFRTTIVFVSHNAMESAYLADRVMVMGHGPAGRIREEVSIASVRRPRDYEGCDAVRKEQARRERVAPPIRPHRSETCLNEKEVAMTGLGSRAKAVAFSFATLCMTAGLTSALAAAPKGDGGAVRIMINPAGTMSLVPFVMKKFKLDEKYGFKLESLPYTTANTATAAMQSKSAEIIVYEWLATARIIDGGIDVVGVAPFLTYVNYVLVPKESPIKTIADLKGRSLVCTVRHPSTG